MGSQSLRMHRELVANGRNRFAKKHVIFYCATKIIAKHRQVIACVANPSPALRRRSHTHSTWVSAICTMWQICDTNAINCNLKNTILRLNCEKIIRSGYWQTIVNSWYSVKLLLTNVWHCWYSKKLLLTNVCQKLIFGKLSIDKRFFNSPLPKWYRTNVVRHSRECLTNVSRLSWEARTVVGHSRECFMTVVRYTHECITIVLRHSRECLTSVVRVSSRLLHVCRDHNVLDQWNRNVKTVRKSRLYRRPLSPTSLEFVASQWDTSFIVFVQFRCNCILCLRPIVCDPQHCNTVQSKTKLKHF